MHDYAALSRKPNDMLGRNKIASQGLREDDPGSEAELVDHDGLSAADRTFLHEQETIVHAGRKAFLEAARALVKIRDYKNGLLYKRHGTFEDYCRERWEISRSYAHRIMEAGAIYQELLPRGNNSESALLPTTERQLRELNRLKDPELRKAAWNEAVEEAGQKGISAKDVARAVRATMVKQKLEFPELGQRGKRTPQCYKLLKTDVTQIRQYLKELGKKIANLDEKETFEPLLVQIETLLPR